MTLGSSMQAMIRIAPPQAGEDERIEVGVLVVGGGTAGLACAVRLGQLLAEDEQLLESLGEVPLAVAEKGKAYGSHLLSGACIRPQPLLDLFPDADPDDIPHFGEVTGEAVYFMTGDRKFRIPTPPQMKNLNELRSCGFRRWASMRSIAKGVADTVHAMRSSSIASSRPSGSQAS